MATPAAPGPEDRLDSWKEIAAYLKRGVRTVQRWERTGSLPVHRLDGQGSVFAYKGELDVWWTSHSAAIAEVRDLGGPPPRGRFRWPARLAVSVVFVMAVVVGLQRWVVFRRSEFTVLDPIPLTSDLGSEVAPTFSPDGNQVAYAWDGPSQNQWDIYVKMIGTDSPLRLTNGPAQQAFPAWSPDGRLIAFRRFLRPQKTQIVVIPPIGGAERIISEDPRTGGPLAWSPDNRWIVTSMCEREQGPAGLAAIDVNTGEVRHLTRPPRENWGDSDPSAAPDGSSIVFARDLGSTSELYRLKLKTDFRPGWRARGAHGAPSLDWYARLHAEWKRRGVFVWN